MYCELHSPDAPGRPNRPARGAHDRADPESAPDVTANGIFTPGAPLVGTGGSVRFSGEQTDHDNFAPDTTARSGPITVIPIPYVSTISCNGTTPVNIKHESAGGSYRYVATGLRLTFTAAPAFWPIR